MEIENKSKKIKLINFTGIEHHHDGFNITSINAQFPNVKLNGFIITGIQHHKNRHLIIQNF